MDTQVNIVPTRSARSADTDVYFEVSNMEMILAQAIIFENLSAESSALLEEKIEENYAIKSSSDLYSNHNTTAFCQVLSDQQEISLMRTGDITEPILIPTYGELLSILLCKYGFKLLYKAVITKVVIDEK